LINDQPVIFYFSGSISHLQGINIDILFSGAIVMVPVFINFNSFRNVVLSMQFTT